MTNPILPPCPKCEARLFQVYAGGTKEKVEGVFWCKACKSISGNVYVETSFDPATGKMTIDGVDTAQ